MDVCCLLDRQLIHYCPLILFVAFIAVGFHKQSVQIKKDNLVQDELRSSETKITWMTKEIAVVLEQVLKENKYLRYRYRNSSRF